MTFEDAESNETMPSQGAEDRALQVTVQSDTPLDAASVGNLPVDSPAPRSASAAPASNSLVAQVLAVAATLIVTLSAWIVPGLGHLLLRRWQRALVFFIAVGGLALTGCSMRGHIFPPHSQDAFGTLGFLADAASGVFYILSGLFESAGPNVSRASGDYGTRFVAAAGIVNILALCDVYEIASGRRR